MVTLETQAVCNRCNQLTISGSIFGYVVVLNDTVSVVFRGTDNVEGWIRDAHFKPVQYPGVSGATVHQGFYEGLMSRLPEIQSLLQTALKRCNGCRKVLVSGHSLGGALSTIGGLQFKGIHTLKF